MLTRKRRCLRVTTVDVLLYECLTRRLQPDHADIEPAAPAKLLHAQKFDAEFIFQHPPQGCHADGNGQRLLGNIERKRHHPANRQRLIRYDLATPLAQVVYDSKALQFPAKRTGNSTMYRSFWRLFIDLHTRKLTRIGA